MEDQGLPLSYEQQVVLGHRAEPNIETIVPDEPTPNQHDHDRHSAHKIKTDNRRQNQLAGTATKAAKVLHRRLSVSVATERGSFADTIWKAIVLGENTAEQSTVMAIIAKEPIYLQEPKRLPQLLMVKPEEKVRALQKAEGRGRMAISDILLRIAHRVMVRPL